MAPLGLSNAVLCAGAACLLAGCVEPQFAPVAMTLPPADGRVEVVRVAPHSYAVSRRLTDRMALRVTRKNGADLDYAEGALAKKAAEAYCALYHRGLDPSAMGRFSAPNAWVFDGDCL